jgi:hypothetical protein
MFDFTEETLNQVAQMAFFIYKTVTVTRRNSVTARRNNRLYKSLLDGLNERIAVEAFIAK